MHRVRFIVRELTSFEFSSISGGNNLLTTPFSALTTPFSAMTPADLLPYAVAAASLYGTIYCLPSKLPKSVTDMPSVTYGIQIVAGAVGTIGGFLGTKYLSETYL
jgi:hypothetical protein